MPFESRWLNVTSYSPKFYSVICDQPKRSTSWSMFILYHVSCCFKFGVGNCYLKFWQHFIVELNSLREGFESDHLRFLNSNHVYYELNNRRWTQFSNRLQKYINWKENISIIRRKYYLKLLENYCYRKSNRNDGSSSGFKARIKLTYH